MLYDIECNIISKKDKLTGMQKKDIKCDLHFSVKITKSIKTELDQELIQRIQYRNIKGIFWCYHPVCISINSVSRWMLGECQRIKANKKPGMRNFVYRL